MQREYGLDLSDQQVLERISWRRLKLLVGALGPDSALVATARRRRTMGDTDTVEQVESQEQIDAWLRRRFGDAALDSGPH